jgi:hypothetical protein
MIAAEIAVSPVLTWLVEHGWQLLVLVIIPAINRWFNADTAQKELGNVKAAFWEAALSVVAVVDRELKPKLSSALADGVLTDVEKAELLAEGMRLMRASIAPDLWAKAQKFFGGEIEGWVKGVIERALVSHKKTAAAVTVSTLPTANTYLSTVAGGAVERSHNP